jgi:hypothetical protein
MTGPVHLYCGNSDEYESILVGITVGPSAPAASLDSFTLDSPPDGPGWAEVCWSSSNADSCVLAYGSDYYGVSTASCDNVYVQSASTTVSLACWNNGSIDIDSLTIALGP